MVDTGAKFLVPSAYGDEVVIESRVTAFRRSSFDVAHRLLKADGALGVEGARRASGRRATRRPAASAPPRSRRRCSPPSRSRRDSRLRSALARGSERRGAAGGASQCR